MKLRPLDLDGLFEVVTNSAQDARGSFLKPFHGPSFAAAGLPTAFAEVAVSTNRQAGTVRGLHFQRPPHREGKLVVCLRGAIYDVALDVRPDSASFGKWAARTLQSDDGIALYLAPGFAHGFQTLSDDTEVLYLLTEAYAPDHAAGVRYNDPCLAISWPLPVVNVSPRDSALPLLQSLPRTAWASQAGGP